VLILKARRDVRVDDDFIHLLLTPEACVLEQFDSFMALIMSNGFDRIELTAVGVDRNCNLGKQIDDI